MSALNNPTTTQCPKCQHVFKLPTYEERVNQAILENALWTKTKSGLWKDPKTGKVWPENKAVEIAQKAMR